MGITMASRTALPWERSGAVRQAQNDAPPGSLLDYALRYSNLGWAVLPLHHIVDGACSCGRADCKSPGKHPRTSNGVTGASKDHKTIRGWWGEWPEANIGIAMGKVSGVWALDVDPRHGGDESLSDLIDAHGKLPDSNDAVTGGGGSHHVFRYTRPVGNRTNIMPGLDSRGDNGYIVVEPSVHLSGTAYAWDLTDPLEGYQAVDAPDWLMDRVGTKEHILPAGQAIVTGGGHLDDQQISDIKAALAWLDPDAKYSRWIDIGLCLKSTDDDRAFDLWDEWSKRGPKYDGNEMWLKWQGFKVSGGAHLESVFYWAMDAGWPNKQEPVSTRPVAEIRLDEVEPVIDADPHKQEDVPAQLLSPPGVMGDLTSWINATAIMPQPRFAMIGALMATGAMLGRRYVTQTGLQPNLYLNDVGPTASGKDHPRKAIRKLLREAGHAQFMGPGRFKSGESIFTMLRACPNRIAMMDEIGKELGRLGSSSVSHERSIMTAFMTLYSDAQDQDDGAAYASNTDGGQGDPIDHPCLSLYGSTTEEELVASMGSMETVNGFLNRMLMIPTATPYPEPRLSGDDVAIPESWGEWVEQVRPRYHQSGGVDLRDVQIEEAVFEGVIVPSSAAAQRRMHDYALHIRERRIAESKGAEGALRGRAWEQASKLALLFSMSRDPARRIVDTQDVELAIDLVEWSLRYMINLAETQLADSDDERIFNSILSIIRSATEYHDQRKQDLLDAGLMPRNTLLRLMHMKSWNFDQYLDTLVERNDVEIVEVERKNGRKITCVKLHNGDDGE
jgi:hypothetical protein